MGDFKHIFFDLDHTLWDFEANSRSTLDELFRRFRAHIDPAIGFEKFYFHYSQVNQNLWKLYRENKIGQAFLRSRRFPEAFEKLGVKAGEWMADFGEEYIRICPTRPHLMPHAVEVLEGLSKEFELHIITNGFIKTQHIKLKQSGLRPFFKEIVTSQDAAAKKPDPKIFDYALSLARAFPYESVYIGDSYEADVIGGVQAGLFTIFFNPEGKVNPIGVPEVRNLKEVLGVIRDRSGG